MRVCTPSNWRTGEGESTLCEIGRVTAPGHLKAAAAAGRTVTKRMAVHFSFFRVLFLSVVNYQNEDEPASVCVCVCVCVCVSHGQCVCLTCVVWASHSQCVSNMGRVSHGQCVCLTLAVCVSHRQFVSHMGSVCVSHG